MTTRHKSTTLPIGTISSGTLRLEDLIPALASALSDLRLTRSERAAVHAAVAIDFDDPTHGDGQDDGEFDAGLYDELTTIAESHCPDYAYFGSTDGDGTEIGIWPSIDRLEEDANPRLATHPEVAKVNAGDTFPTAFPYVMEVTDHGNVTLYRRSGRRWIEVWSVV